MRRCGVALVVAGAAALALAALASAATNLIANGTFEGSGSGSLTGWGGSNGTLSLVAGSGGGHAARVKASGTAQVYAYTTTKPVKSTVKGTAYQLDGVVRSDTAGQSVCLKLKELPSGSSTAVGSAQSCVTTTTAWQPFPTVSYTTVASGDSLTANAVEAAPASGATYDIDNISLVAGSPPVDTTPPSIPAGVAASANGPSSVSVSWSASTDAVGVTGYDVFRDGSKVATVAGTNFTDTGVQPSTTYSYTVDAFDAAHNTSQPSAAATVTTPPAPAGACGALASAFNPSSPPTYAHVVVIMDENLGYNNWFGSSAAPYSNGLAAQCALATNAVGATHPSQPNYVALVSGVLQVWNGAAQHTAADNLFHQLGAAGMTWQALEESMPTACSGTTSGFYKTGHNPAIWFTDLGASGDGSCATSDVGFTLAGFNPSALGLVHLDHAEPLRRHALAVRLPGQRRHPRPDRRHVALPAPAADLLVERLSGRQDARADHLGRGQRDCDDRHRLHHAGEHRLGRMPRRRDRRERLHHAGHARRHPLHPLLDARGDRDDGRAAAAGPRRDRNAARPRHGLLAAPKGVRPRLVHTSTSARGR